MRSGAASEIAISMPVSADEWNDLARGCEAVTSIDVQRLQTPDSAFSVLANLPRLTRLRIGSPVGDPGVAEIARASSLRVVNLPAGTFTNAGLAKLASLPNLELLRFHSTEVTDAGMEHIAAMPALRFLHLIDVPLTDAGLPALHGLTQLESLYLDGSRCTDQGLSQLMTKLPDLHFHVDQLHLPSDPHAHPHDAE